MVRITPSARRYAHAVFEIARQRNELDAWLSELEQARAVLDNPEAEAVLTSPAVPREERRQLLDRLLPSIRPATRRLLHLLLERDRLELVPQILQDLRRRINEYRGLQTVSVVTAAQLDPAAEELIREQLSRLAGRRVVLETKIDPSLIGGFIARIGDQLYDYSVKGRLERLRQRLVAGAG